MMCKYSTLSVGLAEEMEGILGPIKNWLYKQGFPGSGLEARMIWLSGSFKGPALPLHQESYFALL